MIRSMKIERSGYFAGDYWMHTEAEATARGIKYCEWYRGIYEGDFFGQGPTGTHCLTEPTRNSKGKVILPKMVVPVFYIDHHPDRLNKKFGWHLKKNAILLNLATKRWVVHVHRGRFYGQVLHPRIDSSTGSYVAKTLLDIFPDGMGEKETAFFFEFMRENHGKITPMAAAGKAFEKVYQRKWRKKKTSAFQLVMNIVEYSYTGLPMNDEIKDALAELNLSPKWTINKLKNFVEDDEMNGNTRLSALKEIAYLTGVKDDPGKENKNAKQLPPPVQIFNSSGNQLGIKAPGSNPAGEIESGNSHGNPRLIGEVDKPHDDGRESAGSTDPDIGPEGFIANLGGNRSRGRVGDNPGRTSNSDGSNDEKGVEVSTGTEAS